MKLFKVRGLRQIRRGIVMAKQGIPPVGEPELTVNAYQRTQFGVMKRVAISFIKSVEEQAVLDRLEQEL